MGSEWQETTVEERFELVPGFAFKSKDFIKSGVPVIKIKNVKAGFFSEHDFSYVSPEFINSRKEKLARVDDLLISMSGNRHDGSPETWVGKVAMFDKPGEYFINQRVGALRVKDTSVIYSRFASYLLSSWDYQQLFISIATSSGGQANLSPGQILGAPFEYPPLLEQKAIAHILGSLDDKIELNRRMNATLEGMAQVLFKSWFVDFDPVIDNALAAGNPIPEQLAERAEVRRKALANGTANREAAKPFPAAFQLTEELGWIPEGWKVKELGAITTELRRGISPKYTDEDGVRVINQRCIRDHSIIYSNARLNDTTKKKVDGRHLQTGDLLINSTGVGTLGRMAQVLSLEEPTVTDSHITVVRSDPEHYMPYTFGRMMISIEPQVEAMGHGSTGQTELSRADLSVIPVIVPPPSIQKHAEALLSEWAIKSEKNSSQNGPLTNLRDTLLPKLISGELRIPAAEKIAEEGLL